MSLVDILVMVLDVLVRHQEKPIMEFVVLELLPNPLLEVRITKKDSLSIRETSFS